MLRVCSDRRLLSRRGLVNFQELVGLHVLEDLLNATWPANLDRADLRFLAQPEVDSLVAGGHETHADCDVVIQSAARGCRELHLAPMASRRSCDGKCKYDPMVAAVRRIHKDARGLVERRHDDIGSAVVVEVAEGRAALEPFFWNSGPN